ncbi:hypothetical protein Pelo_9274 [Pelomyxa schiedti]|nr:hypothetical protein Pelo_9274 [Pelomyxa schiedti]
MFYDKDSRGCCEQIVSDFEVQEHDFVAPITVSPVIVDGSSLIFAWTFTNGPFSDFGIIQDKITSFLSEMTQKALTPIVLLPIEGCCDGCWQKDATCTALRQMKVFGYLTMSCIPILGPRQDPSNPSRQRSLWERLERPKDKRAPAAPATSCSSASAAASAPVTAQRCDHCNVPHPRGFPAVLYGTHPFVLLVVFEAFTEAGIEVRRVMVFD